MKTCAVCKELKEYSEYYNMKASKDGKGSRCKICDDLASRKYKEKHYERTLELQRNRNLKYNYGISTTDYSKLLKKQKERCAICRLHVSENNGPSAKNGSQRLCVDHCHVTNRIRGLLCNNCNRVLGLLKDSVDLLKKAAKYLNKNS